MDIDEFKKMILTYGQELSNRISKAIQPLNELTLPIAVFVLQNYATALKNDPDFNNDFYATLKKALHGTMYRADTDNPESVAIVEEIKKGCKVVTNDE